MHLCVALVGISYDPAYTHRKIQFPVMVDATKLIDNQRKFVFDDLRSRGHTYDVVISTNDHEKLASYARELDAVWVDTKGASLHEREREVLKYANAGQYDGCLLFRCDLVFRSYISYMHIEYSKFNFPYHHVMFDRWKELKFRRVPQYNKHEVGGGLYYIPNRLFDAAVYAFDAIIAEDRIHHLCDYFSRDDIHFISNRRYQSNTDVMQNPLFEFQRSALDPMLNPNMYTDYPKHFRNGYRSVRNVHPDFERISKILQKYLCSIRHRRLHRPTLLDPKQPAF